MLKKFFDHKLWVLLATGLAVGMLVILAAALRDLQFQPGRPLAQRESTAFQVSLEKAAVEIAAIPAWKQILFWALVLVLVLLVAALFPPEWRKKILKYFLRSALFVLTVFYLIKNYHFFLPGLNLGGGFAPGNRPVSPTDAVPAVFTPPHIPSAFLFLISLAVILILAVIAFLASRRWQHNRSLQSNSRPLEGLAEIARTSLADISSGGSWQDAIINCYARMSAVAGAQRGLHRRKDLTAAEFAARLESAGLPGESVRRLTRLFEAARYGTRLASQAEIAEASACLKAVLQACGVNE